MTAAKSKSVHDRLLNLARSRSEAFNRLLIRYALERFLYRLSISPYQNQFCLKGAMLFDVWFGIPHRPTRDIDLLGFGPDDPDALKSVIQSLCDIDCEDDGMRFDAASVVVEEIREAANYAGLRAKLSGYLGGARCPVQVDVGYGDAVTPKPVESEYPVLLEGVPAPQVATYPRVTVMAEKLEAIVTIGMANSRMKDYFDLLIMSREAGVELQELAAAIAATFRRRGTTVPVQLPIGLSHEFATDTLKQKQWKAFLSKNELSASGLEDVIAEIRNFYLEVIHLAADL